LEEGTVIEVADGTARIEMARTVACAGCRACIGSDAEHMSLEVAAVEGIKAGMKVTVEIPTGATWLAILLVFVVPLIALIVGTIAGKWVAEHVAALNAHSTLASVVGGLALLVCAFVAAWLIERRVARSGYACPRVVDFH